MSRHSHRLSPVQLSFYDERAFKSILTAYRVNEAYGRPWKRQRTETDPEGWIFLHEIVLECRFSESIQDESTSDNVRDGSHVDIAFEFNEPVLTVLDSRNEQPLLAYICNDNERVTLERVDWNRKLSRKAPQCLRCHSTLSFLQSGSHLEGFHIKFRSEIRFDYRLHDAPKLFLKDRVAIFDHVFGTPGPEIKADDFYSNITGPSKDSIPKGGDEVQHHALTCKLFPFQARAVAWMLGREGQSLSSLSSNTSDVCLQNSHLPPLWKSLKDLDGRQIYVNRHQGLSTTSLEWLRNNFPLPEVRGGILAEVRLPAEDN